MNRAVVTSLSAIGIAQGLKVFTNKYKTGSWDWKTMFHSGGMPSSHSAGVSALATYSGAKSGIKSLETALSIIFGIIVMYDAQGIRRHTGEIAELVNHLDADIQRLAGEEEKFHHQKREKELNELIGHQPQEVTAGALLGILIGWLSNKMGR